jgi:hypothetical protein
VYVFFDAESRMNGGECSYPAIRDFVGNLACW